MIRVFVVMLKLVQTKDGVTTITKFKGLAPGAGISLSTAF